MKESKNIIETSEEIFLLMPKKNNEKFLKNNDEKRKKVDIQNNLLHLSRVLLLLAMQFSLINN